MSEAAFAAAKASGVDLVTLGWHDQTKFDKKREMFHREHTMPVRYIRDECLKQSTVDDVIAVFRAHIDVVCP